MTPLDKKCGQSSETTESAFATKAGFDVDTPTDEAEDCPWQDEEITRPIYKLSSKAEENDSLVATVSPIIKKRKREVQCERPVEKEIVMSRELSDVLMFIRKLSNKMEVLKKSYGKHKHKD